MSAKAGEGWLKLKGEEKAMLVEVPEEFKTPGGLDAAIRENRSILFKRIFKDGNTGTLFVRAEAILSFSFNDF